MKLVRSASAKSLFQRALEVPPEGREAFLLECIGERVIERFETERQALARMDQPPVEELRADVAAAREAPGR